MLFRKPKAGKGSFEGGGEEKLKKQNGKKEGGHVEFFSCF